MSKLISIVIPIHNEEASLPILYERLVKMASGRSEQFEFIFINDASKDGSFAIMQALHKKDPRVKVANLSRNFGHQIAVTAGIDLSNGDAVILMDGDLQDPPEVIPQLVDKWHQGFEVVYAVRETRSGETIFKKFSAQMFYRTLRKITGLDLPVDAGDFRLMGYRMVHALQDMREGHRYIRGMVSWVGYKQTGVMFSRDSRYGGETKYTLLKMIKFALDGITSFSDLPLKFASYLGSFSTLVAVLLIIKVFVSVFIFHDVVPGWASLMVVVLFIGGVQLVVLGIMGEYIGRTHDEVRQRPLYFLDETLGFERKE
jgi:glycosyltransferase involved in cell wall biosynthesis